jgi:oligopeptide/dipeptide ABC transporter ATP-binding protein
VSSAVSIQAHSSPEPLLRVTGLVKRFPLTHDVLGRSRAYLEAVGGVDLEIAPGETVGLVGESGCGKSTLARLVLRLIEPTEGSIQFGGIDVLGASRAELRSFRRQAQIVFQDPFGSLDPRLRVGSIVSEGMSHLGLDRTARRSRVAELLELVELPESAARRFPHEFSGGQRQRISIARALAVGPRFVVADEPVSSLDVSVQSKILNLLSDLQERLSLTYLFISHDMSVVRHLADRVAVMYLGKIVEVAPAHELFENPRHPYTQALLSSVPKLHRTQRVRRIKLTGDVPTAVGTAEGCRFASRCFRAIDRCTSTVPMLEQACGAETPHTVACFNPGSLDEVGNAV